MSSYLADHRISLGRSWNLKSRLVPLNASICNKFHQKDLGWGRADMDNQKSNPRKMAGLKILGRAPLMLRSDQLFFSYELRHPQTQ